MTAGGLLITSSFAFAPAAAGFRVRRLDRGIATVGVEIRRGAPGIERAQADLQHLQSAQIVDELRQRRGVVDHQHLIAEQDPRLDVVATRLVVEAIAEAGVAIGADPVVDMPAARSDGCRSR
jgi:hypothetical protein